MKLEELLSEAQLTHAERRDWADNLERSISLGHVKRPMSDVAQMRHRLPKQLALVRALRVLVEHRSELPAGLLEELEAEL